MSDQDLDFVPFIYDEELYQIEEVGAKSVSTDSDASSPDLPDLDEKEESNIVEEPAATYLETQKEVLVLFENEKEATLSATDATYLIKILSSIKLTEEKVDLINVSLEKDYQTTDYKQVLSFTSKHNMDNIETLYQMSVSGDAKVVVADNLVTLAASPDLRLKFWKVLQEMFEV